jgi:hypothetical protein
MIRKLVFTLAGLTGSCAVALAQLPLPLPLPIPPVFPAMQGTPEDQAACSPDANRFCKQYLSERTDQMQVLGCFKSNRPRLSPACRAVLEKYGQ